MKKEYRCTLRTKKMIRAAFVELLGEKKNIETIAVGELGFALLSGFGVDVELLPLAVWQSWEETAFPQAVVNLIQIIHS